MQAMSRQMNSVKTAVDEANDVFAKLQKQILEISAVTDQLKLRLDYGFGRKGQNAFIFSINEAF